jgi:hypothetical protein
MTVGRLSRLVVGVLVIAVVVAAVPSGVGGQDTASETGEVDVERVVELYNENVDRAPAIAQGEFAGETIEVRYGEGDRIAGPDDGNVVTFVTDEDGVVTDYGREEFDNPTLRVRTSEATYREIITDDDPRAAFDEAYENGDIRVNGISLTKSVEVEVVKVAVWIGKQLGLL